MKTPAILLCLLLLLPAVSLQAYARQGMQGPGGYNRWYGEEETENGANRLDRNAPTRADDGEEKEEEAAAVLPEAISEDGLYLKLADRSEDYGFRIVIAADCDDTTAFAAGLVQSAIQQATGVTLPVVSDAQPESEREILVGVTARTPAVAGLDSDGYSLRADGLKFYMSGGGSRGVLRGVCAFLEDYCGRRVYAPGLSVFPKADTLAVPAALDVRENAYFSYTEVGTRVGNEDFLLYNGLTGGAYTSLASNGSGAIAWLTATTGTLGTVFCKADTHYASAPDCFALCGGLRRHDALCLSNENVYTIVLAELLALLEEKHSPTAEKQIVSLSQADNTLYCECAQCAALDAQNGTGHAAPLLQFANRLADEVRRRGYDNVCLEAEAAGSTLVPPLRTTPTDGVIVRLTTGRRCHAHTLENADCAANSELLRVLRGWSAVCTDLFVDYTGENTVRTLGPFPNFGVLQADIQLLYSLGVAGVAAADSPYRAECGEEFRALRFYLLAKLLRDPYTDLAAAENEFLAVYYGDGWANLRQFLVLAQNAAGDADGHLYPDSSMPDTFSLSAAQVATCDTLWRATLAACTDGRQVLHTQRSMLSWRYWKACCRVGEFAGDERTEENRRLIRDLRTAGITRYSLAEPGFAAVSLHAYLTTDSWNTPLLALFLPVFRIVFGIGAGVSCLWAALAAVYAFLRKKYFLLVLSWLMLLQAFLLPWHRESFVLEQSGGFWLTNVLLLLTLAAFLVFADCCAADQGRFNRKKLPRALVRWLLLCVLPHTLLWTVPVALGQDRAVVNSLALAFAAVCAAVVLSVAAARFLRKAGIGKRGLEFAFSGAQRI